MSIKTAALRQSSHDLAVPQTQHRNENRRQSVCSAGTFSSPGQPLASSHKVRVTQRRRFISAYDALMFSRCSKNTPEYGNLTHCRTCGPELFFC